MRICSERSLRILKNMRSVSSKRGSRGVRLALGLLAACSVQPALAQTKNYINTQDQVTEPARPLAVIVAQEELATSIELGRIVLGDGGLIGALVDRRPETLAQNAAAKAYAIAKPLEDAMSGFDAVPLALAATNQMLAGTTWFAAPEPQVFTGTSMAITDRDPVASEGDRTIKMTFEIGAFGNEANDTVGALNWNRERTRLASEFAAANSDAREIAVISWRYQLSADFTNMQVIADIEIRRPKSTIPTFQQQLISVVKLLRPTFVEEENVAIWAANDGALARQALERAFARAGEVLPAVIALDAAGYKDATDRKKHKRITGGNYSGPELLTDDTGSVFYAKDGDQRLSAFVAVQSIRH